MIELDLQRPAAALRREIDAQHASRTAKRFRRRRFWRGVGEAIAWVGAFVGLGLAAAWAMGCSDPAPYCEAKNYLCGQQEFFELQGDRVFGELHACTESECAESTYCSGPTDGPGVMIIPIKSTSGSEANDTASGEFGENASTTGGNIIGPCIDFCIAVGGGKLFDSQATANDAGEVTCRCSVAFDPTKKPDLPASPGSVTTRALPEPWREGR